MLYAVGEWIRGIKISFGGAYIRWRYLARHLGAQVMADRGGKKELLQGVLEGSRVGGCKKCVTKVEKWILE